LLKLSDLVDFTISMYLIGLYSQFSYIWNCNHVSQLFWPWYCCR